MVLFVDGFDAVVVVSFDQAIVATIWLGGFSIINRFVRMRWFDDRFETVQIFWKRRETCKHKCRRKRLIGCGMTSERVTVIPLT